MGNTLEENWELVSFGESFKLRIIKYVDLPNICFESPVLTFSLLRLFVALKEKAHSNCFEGVFDNWVEHFRHYELLPQEAYRELIGHPLVFSLVICVKNVAYKVFVLLAHSSLEMET